jgi:hypothetical protein
VSHQCESVAADKTVDFTGPRWWDNYPCITNACLIEKPANASLKVTTQNVCSNALDDSQKTALGLPKEEAKVLMPGGGTTMPGGGTTLLAASVVEVPSVGMTGGGGCKPACNATCGVAAHREVTGVSEEMCGEAKICKENKKGIYGIPPGYDLEPGMMSPGMSMDGTSEGTCAWKPVTNAPGGIATSILSKGTADG